MAQCCLMATAAVIIRNIMWRFLPLDSLSEQDRKFEKILLTAGLLQREVEVGARCFFILLPHHHYNFTPPQEVWHAFLRRWLFTITLWLWMGSTRRKFTLDVCDAILA